VLTNWAWFDYQKPQAPAPEHRRIRPTTDQPGEPLVPRRLRPRRQAIRSFALPRVTNAAVTGQKFTRPGRFLAGQVLWKDLRGLSAKGDYAIRIRSDADAAGPCPGTLLAPNPKRQRAAGGFWSCPMHLGDLEKSPPGAELGIHAEALPPQNSASHGQGSGPAPVPVAPLNNPGN